jgi:hypothetical protein
MSIKKKAAGLSALKNLISSDTPAQESKSEVKKKPPTKRPVASKTTAPKTKPSKPNTKVASSPTQKKVALPVHMPEEAHSKIRELAFHEKISMTQLVLEGIDMMLKSRGLPPLAQPPQNDK